MTTLIAIDCPKHGRSDTYLKMRGKCFCLDCVIDFLETNSLECKLIFEDLEEAFE